MMPIIYIERIAVLDEGGNEIKDVPLDSYQLKVDDENLRFSVREKLTLVFENKSYYALQNIRIFYKSHVQIQEIQDFVDNDSNRVICTDLLIKHYVPKVVDVSISYKVENDLIDISDLIVLEIKRFFNDFEPGKVFNASDLYKPIIYSGAHSYATPVLSHVAEYKQDGTIVHFVSDDEIHTTRIEKLLPGFITAEVMPN
jgi:hypothetical protein